MFRRFLIPVFVLLSTNGFSQELALGQWRVHLPFNKAKSVAVAGDRVFCASEQGLFFYDRSDGIVQPMSKITGLSELSVSTIRYNTSEKTLVVAYENSNIDLIKGNSIINISDIKRKSIIGDKSIYGISFNGSLAYLSCGFGIVVLDLQREEIRDTYIIGPGGTEIKVFDVAFYNGYIYAASESGVLKADQNNPNLANFAVWTLELDDTGNVGEYNIIETFGGKIFVNYAKPDAGPASQDEVLMFDGLNWITPPPPLGNVTKNHSFRSSQGSFIVSNSSNVRVYNGSLNVTEDFNNSQVSDPVFLDAQMDDKGNTWIADNEQGLIRMNSSGNPEFIFPDGPESELVSAMGSGDRVIWITHATRTQGWFNSFEKGKYSRFRQGEWTTFTGKTLPDNVVQIDTVVDMMSLAVDPGNPDHVFFGSKFSGVLETVNGKPVAFYNEINSSLQYGIGYEESCQAVGMGFDDEGNLWVLNSLAAKPVNVMRANGSWKSYSIPGISGAPLFGDMSVDSYGQKWINVLGNNPPNGTGLVVFNDNRTLDDVTDDRAKFLSTGVGAGNLPSADIRAIVEDHDGEIWLGTGKGVAVVYSPSSVIATDNFDVQQVLIQQDGINQYLLETEVVTAIAIDGANRKWFGTEAGGVFLMSADGTEQILTFNESNSPLISNHILAITIDQNSGEVFFGTIKGIISYKGDAIEGEGGCGDVLVYPNPVRENYSGPIAIRGLVPNGSVKITDVSGNLIYETSANGTQAIWNGTNFEGRRAQTGVYLVFSSDSDGSNTCITKLLFIN